MKEVSERRQKHIAALEDEHGSESAKRAEGTMSEEEIHGYLQAKNIRRAPASGKYSSSILCVLPDVVRSDVGPYGEKEEWAAENIWKRPCIARIDNPGGYSGDGLHSFGQIDYYAIKDGEPLWVKSSEKTVPYLVLPNEVYESDDFLFPKSKN